MAHQQNKKDIATQIQLVDDKQQEVEEARVSNALLNEIESLKDQREVARVERLEREFNQTGELEVSQSIVCDREETLSQCETRGKLLAKQKASKQYLNEIVSGLSEAEQARQNLEQVSPNVQILGSKTVSNGFSGQGNYGVKIAVELRGQPRSQACRLLEIDARYCVVENAEQASTDECRVIERCCHAFSFALKRVRR